jgi:hypothetical protein
MVRGEHGGEDRSRSPSRLGRHLLAGSTFALGIVSACWDKPQEKSPAVALWNGSEPSSCRHEPPRTSAWSGLGPGPSRRANLAVCRVAPGLRLSTSLGAPVGQCCQSCCHGPCPNETKNGESPTFAGLSRGAEEDSNRHPVIPDQALNLVTRLSDPSTSRQSVRRRALARTIWTHRTAWMLPRMLSRQNA